MDCNLYRVGKSGYMSNANDDLAGRLERSKFSSGETGECSFMVTPSTWISGVTGNCEEWCSLLSFVEGSRNWLWLGAPLSRWNREKIFMFLFSITPSILVSEIPVLVAVVVVGYLRLKTFEKF